jgi:AcrR family transcriptional regulator
MVKKNFHHGDLRNALIELALEEIEKVGQDNLSLRELAKTLGVSRAAPYRHFENKESLLTTIAEIGLERLAVSYTKAFDTQASGRERLRFACRAYIDFATEQPELYRLIFSGDLDWQEVLEGTADSSFYANSDQQWNEWSLGSPAETFGFFENMVAAALGADGDNNTDAQLLRNTTLIIWSMLHGCAKLKMDGMLSAFTDVDAFEYVLLAVASNAKALKG